jgi:hypothetical protein
MPHGRILGVQQTLRTLVQLHAELGGKLNDNRKHAEWIAADMANVEKVIKLFDPAYNVRSISAKRRYRTSQHFKRGTVFNTALDVLRRVEAPMTPREIATKMLQERRIVPNHKLITDTIAAIHRSLQRNRGKLVRADEGRSPVRWSILRPK